MRVLIFAASRIRTRYPSPERLRAFWTMAIMVTWTGWRAIRSARAAGGIVVASEVGDCARHELCAGRRPAARFASARQRRDFGLRTTPRLSRCHQEKTQKHRAMDGRNRADVKVFVDTAPVMEKPLAAAADWAGRASTPILCRAILAHGCFWAVFSPLRAACRCAGNRPLRRLSGVYGYLPHPGVSRPL